jgi:hypothetical protein
VHARGTTRRDLVACFATMAMSPVPAAEVAAAAAELVEMAALDLRVREELAGTGELFEGYHPRMAEVHGRNAARLREIVEALGGWPTVARVGAEASEAAWLVLQHAIGEPALQRGMLPVIWEHARRGEVPLREAAMLEDRVRALEGRAQRYGTQMDWGEQGELVTWPAVEEPETVDERRAEVGLAPLAETLAKQRRMSKAEGERAPGDLQARRREAEAWARSVGWRD